MTSISSISNYQPQSPLDALENELSSEVSNGTISSSDQSALTHGADRHRQQPQERCVVVVLAGRHQDQDQRPDPAGGAERYADKQSGDRTAKRLLQYVFARRAGRCLAVDPVARAGLEDRAVPVLPALRAAAMGPASSTSSGSSASTALEDLFKFLKEATSTTTSYDSSGQTNTATSTSVRQLSELSWSAFTNATPNRPRERALE